ncbi:MAG TPA: DUF1232 domain-containing protein [Firmicutes bacterium]|uniref:DUF1232 domain-containing protein n=1 Tax=candidate division TA06 bacterium TaxID=2250710 RepID=A0A660S7G2_UNCT6|nr:DUF1232 domain-containing protein [candidate division WOR-3 bacterium]RKX65831.1 MAG: hypothetical protein DRP44_05445 [candidate division TA06 bacterium]HFD04687.1 DUF1232 domain-containing protein [Bacillota bacterium]
MNIPENPSKSRSGLKLKFKSRLKYEIDLIKCLKNSGDIPLISKIFLAIAIGYLMSPIDLIPDFIPIIGALDDVIIVIPLIWLAYYFIPEDTIGNCKRKINKEVL